MDKKTLNEITEKYDNTSPDQLRADLAVLTAINKRSGEILKIIKPEKHYENPRAIIANALVGIYDSISALQRAAYQANDKVVYGFATKLLNGELMDIKANYSKDTK